MLDLLKEDNEIMLIHKKWDVNLINNEIEKLAKPLVEYLKKNCNHYTRIEITKEKILILSVECNREVWRRRVWWNL